MNAPFHPSHSLRNITQKNLSGVANFDFGNLCLNAQAVAEGQGFPGAGPMARTEDSGNRKVKEREGGP
jgi:hypothetical protein